MMKEKVFQEKDGLIVVEIESVPIPSEEYSRENSYKGIWNEWKAETELKGYTGNCYYTWAGPDLFANPGCGILTYKVQIENEGKYSFSIHNRHDNLDPTESNDAFVKVDNGIWVKTFSAVRGEWTWSTFFEFGHHQKEPASIVFTKGLHTLQICGRSNGFSINRFVLFQEAVNGQDTQLPESIVLDSKKNDPTIRKTGV